MTISEALDSFKRKYAENWGPLIHITQTEYEALSNYLWPFDKAYFEMHWDGPRVPTTRALHLIEATERRILESVIWQMKK